MVNQILDKTKLNWEVEQKPLYGPDGEVSNFYGQFRTDNNVCLGVSTDRYHIAQNRETVDLMVKFFGDDLKLEDVKGGPSKGGRRFYISIKGKNLFKDSPAELEQRMIIKNSHDGSSKLNVGFQDKVLICSNGMTRWITREDNLSGSMMHIKSLSDNVQSFGFLYENYQEFQKSKIKTYERFMNTKATMDMAIDMVNHINKCDMRMSEEDFKKNFSSRKFNTAMLQLDLIEMEMGRQGESYWGLLNGITNYSSHHVGSSKATPEDREMGLIDGGGYNINNLAYTFLNAQ